MTTLLKYAAASALGWWLGGVLYDVATKGEPTNDRAKLAARGGGAIGAVMGASRL